MTIGLPAVPQLSPVPGVRLGTANAGLSKTGKDDIALFTLAPSTVAAAVFTRNRFRAAPVVLARRHIEAGSPRALIVNSGNANAGTGAQGLRDAQHVCRLAARGLGLTEQAVLPFSTGVIGARLPVADIERVLKPCVDGLTEDNWLAAARAIMTTDTVPKGVSRRFELDGVEVTLTGIAKGSGMIHPDMATMLAFVAVDAAVARPILDGLLRRAVGASFNRISVDGDTSTNDACVLLATGCADMKTIEEESDLRCIELTRHVDALFLQLAQSLVRDGEGATKFVAVEVEGAATGDDARTLAFAVAHSPLVKTALFASDPNWGRILAVVGRADIDNLDIAQVQLTINDVIIVEDGEIAAAYTEQAGQQAMRPQEINIGIDLGLGTGGAVVWTNDLSYDYVKINAEYRS